MKYNFGNMVEVWTVVTYSENVGHREMIRISNILDDRSETLVRIGEGKDYYLAGQVKIQLHSVYEAVQLRCFQEPNVWRKVGTITLDWD